MTPLCRIIHQTLVIRISPTVLRTATEYHPDFWDAESGEPTVTVTDTSKYMRAVCEVLNEEDPDNGSTRLTRCLDDAIRHAVEHGSEGIDFKEQQP